MGTGDLFGRDNHSSNDSKTIGMELVRKKKPIVKYSTKVNIWDCFSSQSFGHIVCFKQNFNTELMCDTHERGLLLTTRKQFDLDSTIWQLEEDNDAKHTWKVVLNWKANDRIEKLDWSSMSSDLASIENVWQLLMMKLREKKRLVNV